MGRRKFRLSDMMPNAWFYKLRDMRARGRGRGGGGAMQPQPPSSSRGNRVVQKPATPTQGSSALPHRASYYYTTRDKELTPPPPPPRPRATDAHLFPLPLSPPKNSRRRHRLGPVRLEHAPASSGLVPAPVSARRLEPVAETSCTSQRRRDMCMGYDGGEFRRLRVTVPVGDGLHGKVIASETDIIIDLRAEATPERVLRPIATRPARREVDRYEPENRHVELADMTPRASSDSEQSGMGKPRGSSGRRLKTRANSLSMVARKGRPTAPAAARTTRLRSPPLADSYAMVKSSEDPRSDFLESMAEMIAENGIVDPSELEDLLASYLSLNTVEYHGIIIDAFEQIWTSLASVKPRKRP